MAAISGATMFAAKAHAYLDDLPFRLKMLFLVAAGLNMAAFHVFHFRSIHLWDGTAPTPFGARFAGAASLMLWVSIVAFGRWIGFTTKG